MKSEKYKDLLESNPESELFKFSLGQALLEENNPTVAIDYLSACLEKKPDWMMASILRAKCFIALKEKANAHKELERSLELAIDQRHEAPEIEIRKLLDSL